MDKLFELLLDKLLYLVLSICVVLATFFGKPKTAEKLKKIQQKKKDKLAKKCKKTAQKLEKTTAKLEEIEEKEL